MTGSRWWMLSLVVACATQDVPEEGVPAPGVVTPDPETPPVDVEPDPTSPFATQRGTVPLYGGTMIVDGEHVIVADPGTDTVHLFDGTLTSPRSVALPEHTEPFRIATDGTTAWVTLRGTGELAAIDLEGGTLDRRAVVCAEPRGVAVDEDRLLVACASGELVALDPDLAVVQTTPVAPDLRDVVVDGNDIWLSTFRDARVLRVDGTSFGVVQESAPALDTTDQPQSVARVAWRMQAHPDGGVLVLHQAATGDAIALDGTGVGQDTGRPPIGDGENPYGGDACLPGESRNSTHLTRVTRDETTTGGALFSGGPRYDFSIHDGEVHLPNGQFANVIGGPGLPGQGTSTTSVELDQAVEGPACIFDRPRGAAQDRVVTAIAHTEDGRQLAFSREPSVLFDGTADVSLGGDAANADSFDLFHEPASTGLACASCHPEGQDDGHVWQFEDLGPRRTQNLAGGVATRTPFHWDGEFDDLDALMTDVFVGRMGGAEVTGESVTALGAWLDGLPTLRSTPADPARVDAGREVFTSPEAGCADCHFGSQLSDAALHVVRSGAEATKTPSLRGVGSRGPWMSDGCAPTLAARLTDEACGGGDQHGRTSHLTADERAALVAYLMSL
ncbi:MAG: c-type cytochrome [Myxococcota bacterium]